ncbi:MAG: response regulator [Anaerocolumna sp.]
MNEDNKMKLLIVDDEMQIRTGLEQGINWSEMGFTDVFTAQNGVEALELCNRYKTELIITDIRMPGIDGIELSRRIMRNYQLVEIIILSGYSDFKYAKEAIKLGAFDYLLKPININELLESVQRAKDSIMQKFHATKNMEAYQQINRERELQQLILNKDKIAREDEKKLCDYLTINYKKELVAGICSVDKIKDKNIEQLIIYLETYLSEIFKGYGVDILFWNKENLFFIMEVFTEAELERKKKKLTIELLNLNKILKNQFDNTVSVVFSFKGDIDQIITLFNQCDNSLKHRLYKGKEMIISRADITEYKQIPISPIEVEEIREHIRRFDYTNIHLYLQNIFNRLKEMNITSVDFVKGTCLELKNILIATVLDKGVDVESIFEYNRDWINDIPNYYTLQEYFEWIDNLYYIIFEGLTQLLGKHHSRVIVQAVDYISNHYGENINLESTAEYANKSKNYFSYLFKKEMGVSFVEYLNNIRVEQAKKLLDSTDEMTYEISEKVGYSDYKYFSSVFKKVTGMSPIQYRKR